MLVLKSLIYEFFQKNRKNPFFKAAKRYYERDVFVRASSLTITTIFGFVPLIALVLKTLSIFLSSKLNYDIIVTLIRFFFPSSTINFEKYALEYAGNVSSIPFFGIFWTLIGSYLFYWNMESAFNAIFPPHKERKVSVKFWHFFETILLSILIIGIATFFSVNYVKPKLDELGMFIQFSLLYDILFPFIIGTTVLFLTFRRIPAERLKLSTTIKGTLLAAVLYISSKYIFDLFARGISTFPVIYESFALVILWILWVEVAWLIVLYGFTWIAVQHPQEGYRLIYPGNSALYLFKIFLEEKTQSIDFHKLREKLDLNKTDYLTLINTLEDNDYIVLTENNEVILKEMLSKIVVYDILKLFRPALVALNVEEKDALTEHLRKSIKHNFTLQETLEKLSILDLFQIERTGNLPSPQDKIKLLPKTPWKRNKF